MPALEVWLDVVITALEPALGLERSHQAAPVAAGAPLEEGSDGHSSAVASSEAASGVEDGAITGGAVLVRVSGEIDLHTGPRLRGLLVSALSAPLREPPRDIADGTVGGTVGGTVETTGAGAVVVDLREVSFMDSYALGVLVAAHKRAGAAGRGFALVATSAITVKLFAVTGLGRVMPLHPDLTSALSALAAASSDVRR